jgi:hypothetical protein
MNCWSRRSAKGLESAKFIHVSAPQHLIYVGCDMLSSTMRLSFVVHINCLRCDGQSFLWEEAWKLIFCGKTIDLDLKVFVITEVEDAQDNVELTCEFNLKMTQLSSPLWSEERSCSYKSLWYLFKWHSSRSKSAAIAQERWRQSCECLSDTFHVLRLR